MTKVRIKFAGGDLCAYGALGLGTFIWKVAKRILDKASPVNPVYFISFKIESNQLKNLIN